MNIQKMKEASKKVFGSEDLSEEISVELVISPEDEGKDPLNRAIGRLRRNAEKIRSLTNQK